MFCIYAISDSIGETAEMVSRAIACQFQTKINIQRIPYINTLVKAQTFLDDIKNKDNLIIISSIIKPDIKEFMTSYSQKHGIAYISILSPGIDLIGNKLDRTPEFKPGKVWNMDKEYHDKISAIEFAIHYDDSKDYGGLRSADVVLIGLSRTSKTPLSMYLAYKGFKVINIPLIPEIPLPKELFKIDSKKIIALTIDPMKLIEIRKHRLEKYSIFPKDSGYLNDSRILQELDYSDNIIRRLRCFTIDVTDRAIEDTALMIQKYLAQNTPNE